MSRMEEMYGAVKWGLIGVGESSVDDGDYVRMCSLNKDF